MKRLTDQELMRIVQAGDHSPASEIYDRYSERIYNFARRFLRDDELAADATQEAFLRMLKYAHQYREGSSVPTWLFAITANLCRDHFRRAESKAKKEPEELLVNLPTSPDDAPDAELERKRAQIHAADAVRGALDRLTDDQREAIVLFRYNEMSAREIARVVGCSEGAVKTRIFRAMEIIRNCLLPKPPVEPLPESEAASDREAAAQPAASAPVEETNV